MLLLVIIAGCFVWSQYDLLKSYVLAQSLTVEQIENEAANYHRQIDRLLKVDTTRWDTNIFKEGAQDIINEEATYTDVAKRFCSRPVTSAAISIKKRSPPPR